MIARLILTGALLQAGAWAQLQLLHFDGKTDTPVTGVYDIGTVSPGDKIQIRFHVKNLGTQPASVLVKVAGEGFSFSAIGFNPTTIEVQQEMEFDISFSATAAASYTGTITVNTTATTIRATAVPAALLSFGQVELGLPSTADFGQTESGATSTKTFTLTNPNTTPLSISVISVSGAAFQGPQGVTAPLQILAGGSTTFQVVFAPKVVGQATGTLTIDQRTFNLTGLGIAPALQLFQFDGKTDTPVSDVYDAGAAAPGDTVKIRFHIKNPSTQSVSVFIWVKGAGFRFSVNGLNPYTLGSQQQLEFDVLFSPTTAASYSATITANTLSAVIRGTAIPAALLSFGKTQLGAGATADFGQTEWDTSVTKTFTLTNPNSAPVSIGAISVSGAQAFEGPTGIAPLQLAPGDSKEFQVVFAPKVAGQTTATLTIDKRTFTLKGLATDPPLPKGSVVVSSQSSTSSQQTKVSIALASTSKVPGNGTLTLTFQPASGLPDDPAIQFLSGAKRSATVTIAAGDSNAKIDGKPDLTFQTGTTAGTIVFALTLQNSPGDPYTLPIAPAVVNVSTATGEVRTCELDVNIQGFDNTHSVSQLGFTFYDPDGKTIQPGMIRVDATPDFKQYFAANQAKYGGMFTMLATFPFSGDPTRIASADVQLSNAAGISTTQHLALPLSTIASSVCSPLH